MRDEEHKMQFYNVIRLQWNSVLLHALPAH
jgi:hypothetical protein